MRNIIRSTSLLIAGLFTMVTIAACGGEATESAAPAQEETAAAAADAVVIEANDQLQFSVKEFTVSAGEEVTITLQNVGSLPKETFGHNIVFLTMGTDLVEFATAAMSAADNEYLPADMSSVLSHSSLLGPGESDTFTFTAPSAPGQYEFLCTFPGHYGTMRGIMIVE